MSNTLMVEGGGGTNAVGIEGGEGVADDNRTTDKVILRKRKAGGPFNGSNGVFSRPKSEYISPCK